MSTYKLYYFNGRGRAEIIRLIFAQAGQKYEDIRYEHADWPSHKNEMPLGQMPVLEVDGQKIPHSMTIARFVAKQFNLAGKDNLEQAKVDSVIDTIVDLMEIFVKIVRHEKDESKKEEGKKQFFKDDVPKSFANLEKLLTTYGKNGPFFLGDQLTFADIEFYDGASILLSMDASVLDKYPKLKRNYDEVEKQPKIAAYLKSRPQTQF
ncbi:unnamed protein product [Didymodactylos carnosus]|uniref:Uncharacterized protein n=1 Tax=Didymodactylos carnosus TaxID=1234261 RepID=A0A814WR32_9BILA|nr:unnamed protein product [Didymodactylos carnosus]CAF1209057.1 unnamed protein product [Didymodactylos carnosus]CAF3703614.1 unnamed protein product [Didymodactylos carnosus]CAF3973173.1 unnamed protein product [Didymodactylos carnosus]